MCKCVLVSESLAAILRSAPLLSLCWWAWGGGPSGKPARGLYSSFDKEKPPYKKLPFLADFIKNWAPFIKKTQFWQSLQTQKPKSQKKFQYNHWCLFCYYLFMALECKSNFNRNIHVGVPVGKGEENIIITFSQ